MVPHVSAVPDVQEPAEDGGGQCVGTLEFQGQGGTVGPGKAVTHGGKTAGEVAFIL